MAVIDFFRENLFWIVFAVVVTAIFFIYSKLDNSTKLQIRNFVSGKVLSMILFALLWFIWASRGETISIKAAHMYMSIIGLVILVGYNYIGGLKYQTQQIICANGLHGSFSKPPIRINGFLIFALDSFNADGLSWDFAGRILVLREETVQFFDRGAISIARPKVCNTGMFEVEPEIKEEIENNKYLKGKGKQVFYGWFDDFNEIDYTYEQLYKYKMLGRDENEAMEFIKKELKVNNPKISVFAGLYQSLKKSYNKLVEQFDSTVESIEKGVEHHKRVKDSYIENSNKPNQVSTGSEEY